jgi:inhibitor of KinA
LKYTMFPLSENAITIRFSNGVNEQTNRQVRYLAFALENKRLKGIIDIVPTFSSLTIYYDPFVLGPYEQACERLKAELEQVEHTPSMSERNIVIPVCYGGEFGPDLKEVAQYHGLTEEEVIHIHSHGEYKVYMIGFAPGFAYLGGLSPKIATPRRTTPRTMIPAGSVGIAGGQTGIYPLATPGGWQIIGRTPLSLFRPNHRQPSLLCAGDVVQFQPITEKEYRMWRNDGDTYH